MKILIVWNKDTKTKAEILFQRIKKIINDKKSTEVLFVEEKSNDFYEFPLFVINNMIIFFGEIPSDEEIKEAIENPPSPCSGSCSDCSNCL